MSLYRSDSFSFSTRCIIYYGHIHTIDNHNNKSNNHIITIIIINNTRTIFIISSRHRNQFNYFLFARARLHRIGTRIVNGQQYIRYLKYTWTTTAVRFPPPLFPRPISTIGFFHAFRFSPDIHCTLQHNVHNRIIDLTRRPSHHVGKLCTQQLGAHPDGLRDLGGRTHDIIT